MRKGRCSNDPQNCTLASQKAELPYAGIDSVCPECGSPLAAIAVRAAPAQAAPPPPPPPPPPIAVAPAAPPPQADYQYPPRPEPARYEREPDYGEESRAPGNGAMKLTQLVIVGAALALIGFFAWRMFLQPRPVQGPEVAASATVTGVGSQQVTQISPAQLRRVNVATEARGVPDGAGAIIAQLQAGAVLDVTGQINVNGVNWLRISLPNDSSKSGFVREDQMANLGDGGLTIAPIDGAAATLPPGTAPANPAAPNVVGPVVPREPATLYIASIRANVRATADAASTKVGSFEFTDAITVVAQRSVGTATWYEIRLPSGGTGWINARLVSAEPRDIPIDRQTAAGTTSTTPTDAKPSKGDKPVSEIGKSDDQAALMAVGEGATIRVDAAIANLRKEPGATGNSIIEVMNRDTLLSVEDVRIVNGVPWYRVTSPNNVQGWVSGRTVVENR